MASYRVVSSDDHVFEPPDLWTDGIEPEFKERAPRVVRQEDGSDWWMCEGITISGTGGGTQPGRRFEESEKLSFRDSLENARPGGWDPYEHVKDMDMDDVDVSILYPTVGLMIYAIPDGELVSATFRTYNDWLAEYCRPSPKRLKGIAMINLDDVAAGVRELERSFGLGLVGAMITVFPPEDRQYDSPEYEPLWATAQDLGMPLSLHIATNRTGLSTTSNLQAITPVSFCNVDHWVRTSIGHMIFSGVFERYPKLQIGSIEMDLAWVPHFLSRLDYSYTQRPLEDFKHRFKEDMLPSDYFHRNVFLSFQEDILGVRDRELIGVDSLVWGSDYPHLESTFPRSQEVLDEVLADCSDEDRAKIVGGNAARIYGFGEEG